LVLSVRRCSENNNKDGEEGCENDSGSASKSVDNDAEEEHDEDFADQVGV
jgi:hypothetical protein